MAWCECRVVPHITSTRPKPGLIMMGFSEHVSVDDVVAADADVRASLAVEPAVVCVIDTGTITTFSPAVREPGVPFLRGLADGGVVLVLAVSASGLVRMMGSTIALAARLPLQFEKTLDDALAVADTVIGKHRAVDSAKL